MNIAAELFKAFDTYDLWLAVIGAAVLASAILPKLLEPYPLSLPIVLLLIGYITASLPLGLEPLDPGKHGKIIEHVTEFGVIVTLMGAGLKIDRPFSLKGWNSTWRLLGITMILSIALTACIGWWIAAFMPITAGTVRGCDRPNRPCPGIGSAGRSTGRRQPHRKYPCRSCRGRDTVCVDIRSWTERRISLSIYQYGDCNGHCREQPGKLARGVAGCRCYVQIICRDDPRHSYRQHSNTRNCCLTGAFSPGKIDDRAGLALFHPAHLRCYRVCRRVWLYCCFCRWNCHPQL